MTITTNCFAMTIKDRIDVISTAMTNFCGNVELLVMTNTYSATNHFLRKPTGANQTLFNSNQTLFTGYRTLFTGYGTLFTGYQTIFPGYQTLFPWYQTLFSFVVAIYAVVVDVLVQETKMEDDVEFVEIVRKLFYDGFKYHTIINLLKKSWGWILVFAP